MATIVRCCTLLDTAAGRPRRTAGTPICNKASRRTSAAPLLCVTAKTLDFSIVFACCSLRAVDISNAAVLVLPVPGGL